MTVQARHPEGTSWGGRFARQVHAEPRPLDVEPPSPWEEIAPPAQRPIAPLETEVEECIATFANRWGGDATNIYRQQALECTTPQGRVMWAKLQRAQGDGSIGIAVSPQEADDLARRGWLPETVAVMHAYGASANQRPLDDAALAGVTQLERNRTEQMVTANPQLMHALRVGGWSRQAVLQGSPAQLRGFLSHAEHSTAAGRYVELAEMVGPKQGARAREAIELGCEEIRFIEGSDLPLTDLVSVQRSNPSASVDDVLSAVGNGHTRDTVQRFGIHVAARMKLALLG